MHGTTRKHSVHFFLWGYVNLWDESYTMNEGATPELLILKFQIQELLNQGIVPFLLHNPFYLLLRCTVVFEKRELGGLCMQY